LPVVVARIYTEFLPKKPRMPPGGRACPPGARHFGDLADPTSAVSQLVAERGGVDLLPEFGYKPVNKSLPPRPRRDEVSAPRGRGEESVAGFTATASDKLFAWVDRMLSA